MVFGKNWWQCEDEIHVSKSIVGLFVWCSSEHCCNVWQANVVQCFQQLHRLLDEHYTDEDRLIIAAPTTEQVSATF